MKIKTSAFLALLFSTQVSQVHAQGFVNFDTKAVGAQVFLNINNDIRPASSDYPLPFNQQVYGQLYAAAGQNADASALQAVGTRLPFGTGDNAGYLKDETPVVVPTSVPGGTTTVQLRAWTGAETYELAYLAKQLWVHNATAGSSELLNLPSTGSTLNPVDLTDLQGFTMEIFVPEPSSWILMAGGLFVAAFKFRRKDK
jgi:hypothetical protein